MFNGRVLTVRIQNYAGDQGACVHQQDTLQEFVRFTQGGKWAPMRAHKPSRAENGAIMDIMLQRELRFKKWHWPKGRGMSGLQRLSVYELHFQKRSCIIFKTAVRITWQALNSHTKWLKLPTSASMLLLLAPKLRQHSHETLITLIRIIRTSWPS